MQENMGAMSEVRGAKVGGQARCWVKFNYLGGKND